MSEDPWLATAYEQVAASVRLLPTSGVDRRRSTKRRPGEGLGGRVRAVALIIIYMGLDEPAPRFRSLGAGGGAA